MNRPYGMVLGLLSTAVFIMACSSKGDFSKAERSEKLGRFSTAISQYEDYWKMHSKEEKAPLALFRIGEIYRTVIVDYDKARKNFNNVIEWYPQSPWAKAADLALINCPDYFPFAAGQKMLGDSMSGGANARTLDVSELDAKDPSIMRVKRQVLAGEQKVSESEIEFQKKTGEITEKQKAGGFATVILRVPAEKGRKWETLRNNKRVQYNIESLSETVEVRAGTFSNCLKLIERELARPDSFKAQYFAPGKGLVLVTQSSNRQETRLLELLPPEKK